MKKLVTLLAAASLMASSIVMAEDMNNTQPSNPNDVMQTVPNQGNNAVAATDSDTSVATDKAAPAPKAKAMKKKKMQKKNCACSKSHCKTKKHTRKAKHHAKPATTKTSVTQ